MSLNRLFSTVKQIFEKAQEANNVPDTNSSTTPPEDGTTIEIDDKEAERATEEEQEESTEEPEESEGTPVGDVSGIGNVYESKLSDAGITTKEQLAEQDAATLSEDVDIAEGRLDTFIQNAQNE